MITLGFNTLAMLTWGLGIRMPFAQVVIGRKPQKVEFRDKPAGIVAEDKSVPTSFDDILTSFRDKKIGFEDR